MISTKLGAESQIDCRAQWNLQGHENDNAVDRRGEVYKIGEACKANPLAFHTGLPIN